MICKDFNKALQEALSRYEEACVVIDSRLRASYTLPCTDRLPVLWLEVSEERKTIETVRQIWDFLFAQQMTRRGVVVCIGGGVLTDMAGFAAATYKRGTDFITVPTTLLAMVDASTGGKTGCNYGGLKNSVGLFAAPAETLISPHWLATLPAREWLSGFAEMLKTGLIDGERTAEGRLWDRLMQYDLETMEMPELTPLIAGCVAVKERIVAADPHEEGLRKVLNFGHTFGHALEELSFLPGQGEQGGLAHGYAVLYGMIAELYLSVTRLGCPQAPLQQLTRLMLQYYGKPTCRCSDRKQLTALMQQDKKNERAAQINCTLLYDIGRPAINQVIPTDEADEALDYLFSL
jgi:3-dehydroquinate synthase